MPPWGGQQLDERPLPPDPAFPGDRDRRGHHRPRRPGLAGRGPPRPHPARPDRGRQGPAGDRAALGPDAPAPGAWPPGRPDDRAEHRRLRLVGPQGQGVRPADLAHPRRPHPRRGAGLCQHAGLRGRGPRPRPRARAGVPGEGLHRPEMVLPPRPDERPRGHEDGTSPWSAPCARPWATTTTSCSTAGRA